jgi:uncharacterized protein YbaR (Trm112 family)
MSEPVLSPEIFAMLACPVCHGKLALEVGFIRCAECSRRFPVEDGIPVLLAERSAGPFNEEISG